MIIDAEDAPKSPVSPHPTFRQNPTASQSSRSYPVSYSTFSQTPNATNDSRGASEVSTLLYHHQPQAFYDDAQPPAYEDINHNKPKARNRFWTRCAAVFLLICLVYSSWASYRFSKGRRNAPGPPRSSPTQPPTGSKPNVPSAPQNPPRTQPSGPPAVPSPTLAPPPPLPPRDHLPSDPPFVIPTRGRVDLCQSWAYSMDVGSRPSIFDNRPTDQVEYTVPSLEPLHIETGAICPTENGSNELCGDYNDTLDSIAGKLVVTAGDVKLPEIRVTLQHGSKSGLDNISMCLMKKPRNEAQGAKGGSKWVLGLYAWKDRSNDPENYIVVSATIVLTLPKSGVHNLSTGLNYFSQSVGPRGDHDHGRSGTMTFDTLAIHAGVRGEVLIQNVTAAAIKVKTENDNVAVVDCRVSRLVDLTSEAGIVASVVTLVQTEDTPRVEMKMQSTFGAASANTTLEYSPTLENPPRFQIDSHSEYGVSAILVNDPRGTQLLRAHETPPILPIIHINSTSRLAIAQAVVPPTYYGSVQLESQYTSVVVQDHASQVPGRIVEWDRRGQPYRGNVRFNGYHRGAEAGSVYVATQYATSRMLFWGLDDDQTSGWPEHGGVIVLGKF